MKLNKELNYSLTYESAEDDVTQANITAELLEELARPYNDGQTNWWFNSSEEEKQEDV